MYIFIFFILSLKNILWYIKNILHQTFQHAQCNIVLNMKRYLSKLNQSIIRLTSP